MQAQLDFQAAHPVPLNKRRCMPCGCDSERVATADGGWAYIHYVKPGCRFDGKRIGSGRGGYLYVPYETTRDQVPELMRRHGFELADQ